MSGQPALTTEVRTLRAYYPTMGAPFCAEKLGRSLPSIHAMAGRYGIRCRPEGISMARRRGQLKRNATTDQQDLERFESLFVPITETGCWIWMGSLLKGHPRFQLHLRHFRARAWALERYRRIYLNKAAKTATSCGIQCCVNPWHAIRYSRGGNYAL